MKKLKNLSALSMPMGAFCASLFLVAGCVQNNMTNPARTATEQLLLSTSADRAIKSVDFSTFNRKKVFLDATYFDSYDSKNALGTIRDALNSAGALLVPVESNAEYVIEARSGALSTDLNSLLIGVPSTGLPIPLAGTLAIPEIDIYRSDKQYGTAKLALLSYERTTGEHYYSSGPMVGKSFAKHYRILGLLHWSTSDIPEKKRHPLKDR